MVHPCDDVKFPIGPPKVYSIPTKSSHYLYKPAMTAKEAKYSSDIYQERIMLSDHGKQAIKSTAHL